MELEQSLVNYVIGLSLQEQATDPKSTFNTIAREVTSIQNDGVIIDVQGRRVANCCFFISLKDGIRIKSGGAKKAIAAILMRASRYKDMGQYIDTDRREHRECIDRIAQLTKTKIIIYFGKKISPTTWSINPTEICPAIGPGPTVIRMANNGSHFEYITDKDDTFVYKPRTMTSEFAQELQREAEIQL